MCPIVMSTTYGEREGKLDLSVAWEILGGLPCSGICGYIADTSVLERSESYNNIIEKKAENLYRTINQKMESLPASNQAVKKMVSVNRSTDLTPQESEQLSVYASDDSYVMQQKEDLQELTALFRDKMGTQTDEKSSDGDEYIKAFKGNFIPQPGFEAVYKIIIEGMKKPLIIEVDGPKSNFYYGQAEEPDVEITISKDTLDEVIYARMTFQRAFMGGTIKMKGDFKVLRTLDQIFAFMDRA